MTHRTVSGLYRVMTLHSRALCALAIISAGACADSPPRTARTTQADTPAIDFAADARWRTAPTDLPLRGFTFWKSRSHRRADFLAGARPAMQLAEGSTLDQTAVYYGAGMLDKARRVYRYRQLHDGIEVEGASYTIDAHDDRVTSGGGHLAANLDVPTSPAVAEGDALVTAMAATGATAFRWLTHPQKYTLPHGRLMIYSPDFGASVPFALVWTFELAATQPWRSFRVHVDAIGGAAIDAIRIDRHDNFASGTGADGQSYAFMSHKFQTNPDAYRLRSTYFQKISTLDQLTPGTTIDFTDADNAWTEPGDNRRGVSAHYAAAETWGWLQNHGYAGPDNDFVNGAGITTVQVRDTSCDGSHYDPAADEILLCGPPTNIMNPDVDLESVAHEVAHAVQRHRIGGFDYSVGEAGGISEHMADVIATSVQAKSTYGSDGDWLLFEDGPGGGVRHFDKPNADSAPDTYLGDHWSEWFPEPHMIAGVLNYWFYLVAAGGTGTNDLGTPFSVTGIGREDASQIVIETLMRLSPRSKFHDYVTAIEETTRALFGELSPQFAAVRAAFAAVNLHDQVLEPFRLPERGGFAVEPWPATLAFDVPLCAPPPCGVEIAWQIQLAKQADFSGPSTFLEVTDTIVIPGPGDVGRVMANLDPGTVYYWRARARGPHGTPGAWAWASAFETSQTAPGKARPGEDHPDIHPWATKLTCEAVTNATSYEFQVGWTDKMENYATFTETACETTIDLTPNTHYFWRVRAHGPTGPGGWSTKYHAANYSPKPTAELLEEPWEPKLGLRTHTKIPQIEFLNPENGNVGTHPWDQWFLWKEVQGADSYEYQITKDDPTFTNVYRSGTEVPPTVESWEVLDWDPTITYYWRIRAIGHGGHTPWSNHDVPTNQWFKYAPGATIPECRGVDPDIPESRSDVDFGWSEIDGAVSYKFHVVPTTNTNTVSDTTTDTEVHLYNVLDWGTTYDIRVRANGPNGEPGESGPNRGSCRFTVEDKPPSEPAPDGTGHCDASTHAGAEGEPDIRYYDLGKSSGTLTFHWHTYEIKDLITIRHDGEELWSNNCAAGPDPVGDLPPVTESIPFYGINTWIEVRVDPICDLSQNSPTTEWQYEVECP